MKAPLKIRPEVQLVESNGKPTRDGFNLFSEILARLDALSSLSPYTAANIASAANAVNTSGKKQGLVVLDTTNNRIMVARGANATDQWDVADGSASVTPA